MGKLFSLDAGTRQVITDALDDIITEFGRDCRIVYPPKWVACANCIPDNIGKKSANRWKTGGPLPFPNGSLCPVCNGDRKRGEEITETIKLKLEWDSRKFVYPLKSLDIREPYSIVETKGYVHQIPKLQKADHIILDIPVEPYIRYRFKLKGEPVQPGNIIQARYCVAYWERAG